MATPNLQPVPVPRLKKTLIASLGVGAGFALTLVIIVGLVLWFIDRPRPPKPWDSKIIVATEAPGFSASGDGKNIEFSYTIQNTTNDDYRVESDSSVKVVFKTKEGVLSQPLPSEVASVSMPIFIPAKQRSFVRLSIKLGNIPQRNGTESDQNFHERLRAYLEQRLGGLSGVVLFDDANHYQIDLPKWLSVSPKDEKP